MEQLNKIELRGNVGNIRIQTVGDNEVAHFSLATNYAYKGKDGTPVIETTCGRIRFQKFNGSDGTEKQYYEVLANRLAIIENDDMPMNLPAM